MKRLRINKVSTLSVVALLCAITLSLVLATVLSAPTARAGSALPTNPGKSSIPNDCGAWSIVNTANPGNGQALINGIGAMEATNGWAVGTYNASTAPYARSLTERWNGSTWTTVDSPSPSEFYNELYAVDGGLNDAWAVGRRSNPTGALAIHWNGTAWIEVTLPGDLTSLRAVTFISPNNVWAAGFLDSGGLPPRGRIVHWDGTSWTITFSSVETSHSTAFYAMTSIGQNDIWAVGARMMHWGGTAWAEVSTPALPSGFGFFNGIDAIDYNDIWVVGLQVPTNHEQTLVEHWDGSVWTIVPSPNVDVQSGLYGVTASSGVNVWAVGYSNPGSSYGDTLTMYWDGTQWTIVPSPSRDDNSTLHAIASVSSGDHWAVGYSNINGGSMYTLAEHYSAGGGCATPTQAPATNTPIPIPTATTIHPTPTASPTSCASTFTDVPCGSTYYPFVECMVAQGVLVGYYDGCENGSPCFKVNNPITRGQIAKVVSIAAGFSEPPTDQQTFEDVVVGSTFYDYIDRLVVRGYITGYTCGGPGEPCVAPDNRKYFRTGATALRGQIAKIVSNSAGFSEMHTEQTFEDVIPNSPFYPYIERLSSRSIIGGYDCGGSGEPCGQGNKPYFRTGSKASRGQIAKIAANTFFPSCQVR